MEDQVDVENEEHRPLENNTRKIKELYDVKEAYTDLDTGWAWVVLAACFANFCLFGCAQYTGGIIHSTLLDRYHASVYVTSWAGSLHASLISLAGPLSSALADKFSCRIAIITGGCLYVVGYVLTAFAPNVETAILSCGVISGIGGGIAYSANTVVISYRFQKRRTLAMGIAHTGIGVGVFALAPLMQFLRDFYGSIGFFLMLAGIFAHMITFGALCFPNSVEMNTLRQNIGNLVDKRRTKNPDISPIRLFFCKYWNVFSNRGIFFLCIGNFFYGVSIYVLFLYFPNFIVNRGFTASQASYFLSIVGILNIIGRLGSGIIGNMTCTHTILLYSASIGMVGVCSVVYPFIASHFTGQLTYFICLGLFMGPCYVLTPSVTLKFVSMELIATAIGLEYTFAGVGAMLGPVITGLFLDCGGTYEQAIIIAGACSLAASVFSGVTVCFSHPTETSELEIRNTELHSMITDRSKTDKNIT